MRVLGAVAVIASGLLLSPAGEPAAFPDQCPDVEVVFARGSSEPPGVGQIGQSFVDALRWQVGGRSYAVYPVNYPALPDFATTADGVVDAGNHVRDTAANCPNTEIVLGGFSRGAAVIGYVTEPAGPTGALAPEVADHVAAVVLLGKPSNELLTSRGVPPIVIGPGYAGKTIDLCAPGDPVCSAGLDDAAHASYAVNGMTGQAADFAAQHLRPPETGPGQPV
ncbi:MAG TPA: cutinase family protein [Mycobacterium sp.]|nr:cutinase family protein [Mycobacterium sp.]